MNAFKITVQKNTRALVFPSEVNPPELTKESITSMVSNLGKIIGYAHDIDDATAALSIAPTATCKQLAGTIIQEAKNLHLKSLPSVLYLKKVAAATTVVEHPTEEHTLVIHTTDTLNTMEDQHSKQEH